MKRTAFVTGAGGAIGHHVVNTLASRGWSVVGLGHGAQQNKLPLVGSINGEIDATNLSTLATRFGKPDVVIHLAGGSSVGPSLMAPAEDFARTTATSVRVLDWVRAETTGAAVVLASSAAVYGNGAVGRISESAPRAPVSPYGYHKMMMEQAGESWAASFGLRVAIVRLFSVYGPQLHKQLVWELCVQLQRGRDTIILGGTGNETRDWLHISDAAAMLIHAADLASPAAPIFNGCTGRATTVACAADLVARGFGQEATFEFTGESRPGDPVHLVGAPACSVAAGLASVISVEDGLPAAARAARAVLMREEPKSHDRPTSHPE